MDPELCPGCHFHDLYDLVLSNHGLRVGQIALFAHLFERAESTRKADEPTGSPRHLHFALVHRVHNDLCQQANQKQENKTFSRIKDGRRGRADSTDSTLIDKIVPVREEAQNTSFVP